MATPRLSRELAEQAVAAVEEHGGNVCAAARAEGVNRRTFVDRVRVAKAYYGLAPSKKRTISGEAVEQSEATTPRFTVNETASGDKRIWSVSDVICTIDDALAKAGVDPAIWEVKESTISQHQCPMKMHMGHSVVKGVKTGIRRPDEPHMMTMWNVRVLLRRRAEKSLTDALDLIHKRAAKFSPRYSFPRLAKPAGDLLAAVCLFDHHFGKLCWRQETGNDYDLKIAGDVWRNAVADLLVYLRPMGIKQFYIPIGQDLVNFDNASGQTTAGTPQDNDGRYAKVIDAAYWALVWMIDQFASIAEVEAEFVPGNHDLTVSYHLCRELKQHYRHTKRVAVGIDFRKRKYKRWGTNLVGLSHAENVKDKWTSLPNIMATEVASDWAATTHHEWLLGHVHSKSKRETLPVAENDGVVMRTIQALSGTDFWHYDKGYISKRATETYLYSASKGYVGHFSVNAREK